MAKFIELTQGYRAVVDDEDYDRLSSYSWHAHQTGKKVYARRRQGHNGPAFYMHREILNVDRKMVIDHADGNSLNNQKSNIRICTQSHNMQNRSVKRGCSSKYKGVHFYKARGNWTAKIGKKMIGYFVSEEDAARAYNAVAKEKYGEYAKLNEVPL